MMNRTTYNLIAVFSVFIVTSCGKTTGNGECDQSITCYTQKPDELFVKLDLSKNGNDSPVEVTFFKGDIDEGDTIENFTTLSSDESYLMPINEDYSATARYQEGENTIIAVDGDRLSAESFENCDETCYDWDHTMVLDLRLGD
ncbi:MAG: hypothetical protein ACQERC_01550 [Bacteroidota bacterium]